VSGVVSVTRYSGGSVAPFFIPSQVFMAVQEALADMFDRLYRGGRVGYSGQRYVLANRVSSDRATSWDKVVYSSAYPMLDNFVFCGSRFWLNGLSPGTSELEMYLRLCLLQVTSYEEELSGDQLVKAYAMPRKDFLIIVAMIIENGEAVPDLFD
jgi:hypothetical protein